MKRVKIQDVAKEAGVSITTVSRYLNGRYEAMSADTRRNIKNVIDRLGYRPNVLAQALKGNRTRIVAAVVVNMGYPFCVGFIRALGNVLSGAGYHLFVCETGGDAGRERDILASLQAQQVDAIVLQTDGRNNDLLAEMAKSRPVVFVDRGFDVPSSFNVITNNFDASKHLTSYLVDCGYQRIVYVTEAPTGIRTRTDRLAGYEQACSDASIEPWVFTVDKEDAMSFNEVKRTLQETAATPPTAVYTANGLLMMQLHPSLMKLHAAVPEELGLATFDEPDYAALVDPPLTCVRQPIDEMGEYTGNTLLNQLNQTEETLLSVARIEEMPSLLIVGRSTRVPKKS